jgi:hypothetical protein
MMQEESNKKGYVYILVNPAFPGFLKVGKTTKEPETRARELSSGSGVPAPYAVAWDALVTDCDYVEKIIHQQLDSARSRKDREFFAVPLKHAISVISKIVIPFSCDSSEPLIQTSPPINNVFTFEKYSRIRKPAVTDSPKYQKEELIEVSEDSPVKFSVEPPDNSPNKTIARVSYEVLIENPYKYTEREFYYEVHVVRRNMSHLKHDKYNIKRLLLVKDYGWGIHRNEHGKIALVAMESPRYKELQQSIKTVNGFRKNKT